MRGAGAMVGAGSGGRRAAAVVVLASGVLDDRRVARPATGEQDGHRRSTRVAVRTATFTLAPYRHLVRRPGRRRGGSGRCWPLDWHRDDVARTGRPQRRTDLRRPADSPRGAAGGSRRRLRNAVGHPGRDHSGDDGGLRRGRPCADRHRQDGGVRDPDPVEDRHVQPHHPGAGAGAYARTRAAGRRGVQPLRRASARERAADLRRLPVRPADGRTQAWRPGRRRHAGPGHRPPREGHPRPVASRLPGARRGRRDAADGLRRGRRTHPRGHARVQAGRAVLGDHAAGASARSPTNTCTTRFR